MVCKKYNISSAAKQAEEQSKRQPNS